MPFCLSNMMTEEVTSMDNSLYLALGNVKQSVKAVADNLLRVRPRACVTARPFRRDEIWVDEHLGLRKIDLKKLYPEARKDDRVYIETVINACCETDAKINFIGNASVIFNGEVIFDSLKDVSSDGKCRADLHLKEGDNPVCFEVRCDSDAEWIFEFMPSVRWYWIWAKCYLLSARATSPLPEYRGEDGIAVSRLYTDSTPYDGATVYPVYESTRNEIDMHLVYPNAKGKYALALTYALSDTSLTVSGEGTEIFVGEKRCESPVKLCKGDTVTVRCPSDGGFTFYGNGIGIPFLSSSRTDGDKWLILGTFDEAIPDEIQFKKPYGTADGKSFWRLAGKENYLRLTLSSRFFGQWHYTFMVGSFGLYNAYKSVISEDYLSYFKDHMRLMLDYFDYARYEHSVFSSPSFLDISATLHDLDSIGSIGRNLCEYYFLTADPDALPVIDRLTEAVFTNIPRFPDGTFHRQSDMWADDTFMSCPFLVRAAKIKNDPSLYREVASQLLGFKKRLWMNDKGLFSHIYFLDTEKDNRVPWGRGNGWVFISHADAIEGLPTDTNGYDELVSTFSEHAKGLCSRQDSDGLLHQVLDRPDSYSESSSTAMLIIGLCKGMRMGILGNEYAENVKRAYFGLLRHKIKADGTVSGVCMGSGNSCDAEYYMRLGTVENDDHGMGVILTALHELDKTGIL